VAVIIVRFSWKFNYLDRFQKNTQVLNFMKILPWGLRCSMQMDGKTNMMKLMLSFRNFAKTSIKIKKNCQWKFVTVHVWELNAESERKRLL